MIIPRATPLGKSPGFPQPEWRDQPQCTRNWTLPLYACVYATSLQSAPLSMEFSRQEYWSALPCPPPGDLPNPGSKPMSLVPPASAAAALP